MKPQLSSITIAANNLPLLREFYTTVFGWEILMQNPQIVILKLQETLLSLCTQELFTNYTGVSPSAGKSFYFTVGYDNAAEVDQQFATLKAKGANVTKMPVKTFWGGYAGFITDPEGNLWELSATY